VAARAGSICQKPVAGNLQFRLPIGFRWTQNGKVKIDPDRLVRESVHLVFTKMRELGSARQVLFWFRGEKTSLPSLVVEAPRHDIVWKLRVYNTVWHMLGIRCTPPPMRSVKRNHEPR
jgi:hypothetical protein